MGCATAAAAVPAAAVPGGDDTDTDGTFFFSGLADGECCPSVPSLLFLDATLPLLLLPMTMLLLVRELLPLVLRAWWLARKMLAGLPLA